MRLAAQHRNLCTLGVTVEGTQVADQHAASAVQMRLQRTSLRYTSAWSQLHVAVHTSAH